MSSLIRLYNDFVLLYIFFKFETYFFIFFQLSLEVICKLWKPYIFWLRQSKLVGICDIVTFFWNSKGGSFSSNSIVSLDQVHQICSALLTSYSSEVRGLFLMKLQKFGIMFGIWKPRYIFSFCIPCCFIFNLKKNWQIFKCFAG